MRQLVLSVLLLALLLGGPSSVIPITAVRAGGTYTSASCSRTDVDAVINGPTHTAVDGDVIQIPAGTCTWTNGIIIPAGIGISIIGAGTTDPHNPSGAGSQTIIIDGFTGSPPSWLFYFTPSYGASISRISSLILTPQLGLANNALYAPFTFEGTCTLNGCPNVRVDHVVFPTTPAQMTMAGAVTFSGIGSGTLNYTSGNIWLNGVTQAITSGTITPFSANLNSCSPPTFPACAIIYWPGSGTALAQTSSFSTATSGSNIPVAYVWTDSSGDVLGWDHALSWGDRVMQSGTMVLSDNVFGVLDRNSLYLDDYSAYYEFLNYNHSAWKGVGFYGDNSWASASSFGTNQALYVETNYLEMHQGNLFPLTEAEGGFTPKEQGGGRVVCRFNTGVGLRHMCTNHGTESNGRPRGARQMEFYKNSMDCPNAISYPGCWNSGMLYGPSTRSGSLLALANTYTGRGMSAFSAITEYRSIQSIPSSTDPNGTWGACDGTGPWDNNTGSSVVYTGTMTMVNAGTWTFTDTGLSSFMPAGGITYSVHDTTTGDGSQIMSYTSSTLTGQEFSGIHFNNGDSYDILNIPTSCLDQSGRIGGSLLSGDLPFSNIMPTNASGGWVNQTLDPVYQAGDTNDQGFPSFGGVSPYPGPTFIANQDYYAEVFTGFNTTRQTSPTSPFNGTVGTGYGTMANLPTTCTTGVGYLATDQGAWNTSGSGGQGVLYICTTTNTWTLSYTPYDYPHPLTGNTQSFSSQPTNTVTGNAISPFTVTVNPAAATSITVSVTSGTCTFTGTATQTSDSMTGIATFSLTAGTVGTSCVLTAHNNTDGTIADVMSNSFNIIAGGSGGAARRRLRR